MRSGARSDTARCLIAIRCDLPLFAWSLFFRSAIKLLLHDLSVSLLHINSFKGIHSVGQTNKQDKAAFFLDLFSVTVGEANRARFLETTFWRPLQRRGRWSYSIRSCKNFSGVFFGRATSGERGVASATAVASATGRGSAAGRVSATFGWGRSAAGGGLAGGRGSASVGGGRDADGVSSTPLSESKRVRQRQAEERVKI